MRFEELPRILRVRSVRLGTDEEEVTEDVRNGRNKGVVRGMDGLRSGNRNDKSDGRH